MQSYRTRAIRCEHDGLKMAEVKAGFLILRQRHHGETHIQVVSLRDLLDESGEESAATGGQWIKNV